MIPRDTVDRIYSAAHIEEVVADYVSLKKRGANLIGLCPFHNEKTGSFTVSPAKNIYKCFGCGKAGSVTSFIMEIEQCSYGDALRLLAKRYHIEIEERALTEEEKQQQDDRESMFLVNDFAARWFEEQLWNTREGQTIGLTYLRQRGLRDDIIRRFRLGYSPDKNLFSEVAKQRGFDEKYLLNDPQNPPYIGTGLCGKSENGRLYDRFHSRVIFPFFSLSNRVIGFTGRILKQNDKAGKYYNSPASPLFEKHNELYGLLQAKAQIVKLDSCILVEGQMDVISMHQAGIENVVCSGGTSLTKPQIRLIHRFTSNITILYDGDKAGIKAALRGIDMVLEEGINLKVVLLPEGEDPDSFTRAHNANEVVEYISSNQTDFIRFKTNLLKEEAGHDPIKRSELVHSVMQSVSVIPDAITRQEYLKDCAELLDTHQDMLAREVAKLRNNRSVSTPATNTYSNTPDQTKQQSAQSETAANNDSKFNRNMQNLVQLLMRHGEKIVFQDEKGQDIQCGEYIISSLQDDQIMPRLPLHRLAFSEYAKHKNDAGFKAEPFFVNHPDNLLSALAIALTTDPYPVSRIFGQQTISDNVVQNVKIPTDEDVLPDLTVQLIAELKYTVINEHVSDIQEQLKQAQQLSDWDAIRSLLTQLQQWKDLAEQFGEQLGQRVITP